MLSFELKLSGLHFFETRRFLYTYILVSFFSSSLEANVFRDFVFDFAKKIRLRIRVTDH